MIPPFGLPELSGWFYTHEDEDVEMTHPIGRHFHLGKRAYPNAIYIQKGQQCEIHFKSYTAVKQPVENIAINGIKILVS